MSEQQNRIKPFFRSCAILGTEKGCDDDRGFNKRNHFEIVSLTHKKYQIMQIDLQDKDLKEMFKRNSLEAGIFESAL